MKKKIIILIVGFLFISSSVFTYDISDSSLIGHWRFDETGGTTAYDSSGNNNHGILVNGPAWTSGKIAGALSFDGTDDHVNLGTLDVSGSGITISAWFKANSISDCGPRLISKAIDTAEQSHWWMLSFCNGKLRYRQKTDATTNTLIGGDSSLSVGTWYHAAAVYDGSSMKIYQDGFEIGTLPKTGAISADNAVEAWIGGNPDGSYHLNGIIDDIRIYSRALNDGEIVELYNYTGAPPTCSSFTYSSWSECQPDGTQTRIIIASLPDGCTGGDPVTTQTCTQPGSQGFEPVDDSAWSETAVRKVLHIFAYGGFATDEQIEMWAIMPPHEAIQEMLTFDVVTENLSPVEDDIVHYGGSLEELQQFLSSADPANPTCPSKRKEFNVTQAGDNIVHFHYIGLQNTWIAAANKRGLNPFRQKVGLWLSNYHMAVSLHNTTLPLIMEHYDSAMEALEQGSPFHEVLAIGATSAAVAMSYGHQYNNFDNQAGVFSGNDNFAREFHQLFFRINGDLEDADYHENTTIEHTAWALTGMQLDKRPGAYGVTAQYDWWVAPIRFTDHWSWGWPGYRYNKSLHYDGDLEILHHIIVGSTAEEKIFNLARVAIEHQESMENLPVDIINYFADDNLTDEKVRTIRAEWRNIAGTPDDLLRFLQAYAISTTFHREDTYKYRTAFSRNMTIYNLNTVDNKESYGYPYPVRKVMKQQGVELFRPVHDVFGGQTSLTASDDQYLFKRAYDNNVNFPEFIAKTSNTCIDDSGNTLWVWEKDWAHVIPFDKTDGYMVKKVGDWLWNRFIGDGNKNYGLLEQAYVTGFLATGYHFGYIVDPDSPDVSYSEEEMKQERLLTIINTNENAVIPLDSTDPATRHEANRRVGMAINFITMTPFMFAIEGK